MNIPKRNYFPSYDKLGLMVLFSKINMGLKVIERLLTIFLLISFLDEIAFSLYKLERHITLFLSLKPVKCQV